MIEGARRFRQSPSTPWRRVGGDVILAPPGRDDFDVLSGTGADVWELLDQPSTTLELVHVLAGLYEVPADEIASDVERLIETLLESKALEEIEDTRESHVAAR